MARRIVRGRGRHYAERSADGEAWHVNAYSEKILDFRPAFPYTDPDAVLHGITAKNNGGWTADRPPRVLRMSNRPQLDSGKKTSKDEIDQECLALCNAINKLPGIWTTSSCCGHHKRPYRVFFRADHIDALPNLLYWLDPCHSGCRGWEVHVGTDRSKSLAMFMIEGPVGQQAYLDSAKIAEMIEADLGNVGANRYSVRHLSPSVAEFARMCAASGAPLHPLQLQALSHLSRSADATR